jgi:hypothetical protein
LKPKHAGGYTAAHAELCERTLITLLRGLGPWKSGVYLVGGLVPRYLIPRSPDSSLPPHAGTTDVDLVLDLAVLAEVQAYRRLEKNLQAMGFVRGINEEGHTQHHSWRRPVGNGITVVIDLLCDSAVGEGGEVAPLPGERRLSALKIRGAHLVTQDYVQVELTGELLDQRGVATEMVRVAGVVAFLVLKALAYDDRAEEKDAYDIVYSLMHYGNGPEDVAAAFAERINSLPDEPLPQRAVDILRRRFASDDHAPGARKDGPTSHARFLADPGRSDLAARHRADAASVVEQFLSRLDELTKPTHTSE